MAKKKISGKCPLCPDGHMEVPMCGKCKGPQHFLNIEFTAASHRYTLECPTHGVEDYVIPLGGVFSSNDPEEVKRAHPGSVVPA